MVYLVICGLVLVAMVLTALLYDGHYIKSSLYRFGGKLQQQIAVGMSHASPKSFKWTSGTLWTPRIPKAQTALPLFSFGLIVVTLGLCYRLVTSHSLEVYHHYGDDTVTTDAQIGQLLAGEQLQPPPAPPEEAFAELDAEIASYQAAIIQEGDWSPFGTPSATDNVQTPPDLSALSHSETMPTNTALSTHISTGQINIKNADRNWNKMNSEFVQRLLTVYKVMHDQYGYDMVLLEGYRSPERQARLLSQGTHVTKAGSYKSYHQFGLAADSAFIRNGKIVISEKDPWAMQGYRLYGQVAKSAGLVWGGDWKMMDLGHVELRKKGVLGRPEMAEILTKQ
ncbi:M15 family metallopeptidase [Psychrobacter aestuarii]|uniref:Peptidase M15C domain-containing protein n=1 Tax=Psychrobacter aestuarii TaxID=556327 RepID=A0ABP3FIB7_9GAMM|nr:M15 family metallopeptidase [Psychrobacter aestuarii]